MIPKEMIEAAQNAFDACGGNRTERLEAALTAALSAVLFKAEPREGGYTFVTAPGFPGFNLMLKPGESNEGLLAIFAEFIKAESAASQWRGIESAPKDGSWILGHIKGPLVTAYPMFWDGSRWTDGDPDGDPFRPTHWQPQLLPPSPPEEKAE